MVENNELQNATSCLCALAAVGTALRLYIRFEVKLWWWDDTLALLAMASMFILLAGTLLASRKDTHCHYLMILGYYVPLWFARLSILFTIFRLAPHRKERIVLSYIAGLFVAEWVFLLAQAVWVSEGPHPLWHSTKSQPLMMSVAQLITDVASDIILVISPLWILRNAQLDPDLRFRLVCVFFVALFTTLVALARGVMSITIGGTWTAICSVLEVFVSISVSNAYALFLTIIARSNRKDRENTSNETVLSTAMHL